MICQNCKKKIPNPSKVNIAHILPKGIFKSVSTVLNNSLYLCGDCHNKFDSSWSNARQMFCWALALKRYSLFKNEVTEKHIILTYFEQEQK